MRETNHFRPGLFMCSLSIFSFLYTAPVYAAPAEWTEFARALNNSMGGHQLFTRNTFVVIAMTIAITVLLAILNHIYWKNRKKEIENYEKKRLVHLEQSSLQQPAINQRRKWFRIKTSHLLKWINSRRAAIVKENQYNKDQLVDISGGGLSFTTKSAIVPEDELNFLLDIGGKKPLKFKGKVLRVQDDGDTVQPTYFVAIQFSELKSGERDRLVSWILKGQREELHEIKLEEDAAPPA